MTNSNDKMFNLELAKIEAKDIVERFKQLAFKIEIVGSIRRERPKVHDIDIVMIPANTITFEHKIIKGISTNGIPFEIYIADEDTYEVIKLIRTGSAGHNRLLCSKAKAKGWKLHADGQGLETEDGFPMCQTEVLILKSLLGKYVEPKDREAFY